MTISPECRAFSILMNANEDKMDDEELAALRERALAMLHFAIEVAAYQIERGRWFLLEQPAGASSWQTHAMTWLMQQAGVLRFVIDMCMAGLCVRPSGDVSRKPTGIICNHLAFQLFWRDCNVITPMNTDTWKAGLRERRKSVPQEVP